MRMSPATADAPLGGIILCLLGSPERVPSEGVRGARTSGSDPRLSRLFIKLLIKADYCARTPIHLADGKPRCQSSQRYLETRQARSAHSSSPKREGRGGVTSKIREDSQGLGLGRLMNLAQPVCSISMMLLYWSAWLRLFGTTPTEQMCANGADV